MAKKTVLRILSGIVLAVSTFINFIILKFEMQGFTHIKKRVN